MAARHPALNHIRTFVLVAQSRSFSLAARELNVTQGAVSQQIARLESYLNVRLFRRSRQGPTLTTPGLRLLMSVADPVQHIDRAVAAVRARPGREVLGLTTVSSFAAQWLIPRLARFEARAPEVKVRIESTTLPLDLAGGGLDAGIRYGTGSWAGLTSERLLGDTLVTVATPTFAATLNLDRGPAALRSVPLLFDLDDRDVWLGWFAAAGLDTDGFDFAWGYSDLLVMLSALANGQPGVALINEHLVQRELATGALVRLFEQRATRPGGYYLVYPSGAPLRDVTMRFREWILQEAQALAAASTLP